MSVFLSITIIGDTKDEYDFFFHKINNIFLHILLWYSLNKEESYGLPKRGTYMKAKKFLLILCLVLCVVLTGCQTSPKEVDSEKAMNNFIQKLDEGNYTVEVKDYLKSRGVEVRF